MSTIRTFTPAIASALAHMTPAGPAPMMRTSTFVSLVIVDVNYGGEMKRLVDEEKMGDDGLRGMVYIGIRKEAGAHGLGTCVWVGVI